MTTIAELTVAGSELAERVEPTRPLTVEFGRYPSACTMLIDALGGAPFGAPYAWRKAAVSQLDHRDIATLAPFLRSPPHDLPSCLCVLPHRTRAGVPSLEEDLERIATQPPEQLLAQLPCVRRWDDVARNPRRWLDRFVRSIQRACEGLDEPWRRVAGLLDREAERVGVAVARGTERELIATTFPTELMSMKATRPHGAELGESLSMVPLLAGPRAPHVWLVDGELSHIAYPVPGAWQLLERPRPAPAVLEALLGVQRSQLLRTLDRPVPAGHLAGTLMAVPSAVTHHLAILERAGLICRERDGRHVLVHRTVRGTRLLGLYE